MRVCLLRTMKLIFTKEVSVKSENGSLVGYGKAIGL